MSTSFEFLAAFDEWEHKAQGSQPEIMDTCPFPRGPRSNSFDRCAHAELLKVLTADTNLDSIAKNGRPGKGKNQDGKIEGFPRLAKDHPCKFLDCEQDGKWEDWVYPSPEDLRYLPDGSALLQVDVILQSPFFSRDDRTFYPTENVLKRHHVFMTPYLAAAGLKGLGYFENGFRQLTCNKDINTLADLNGLKIRVMENEIHLAIWTALGANPGPLAFGELYTALQQKSFDAQENPAELIYNTKFYEVQDHVYLTSHIYTPYIIYMNLDAWNSLNAQTQELVQECMDEAVAYCREICEENEQACFDAINDSGISKTYEVSDELHQEMVDACTAAGIYDLVVEKAGGTYAEDLWAAAGFSV